jgi:hypothetical protein
MQKQQKFMIDQVIEAYTNLVNKIENEVGEKISVNGAHIEKLLIDTIINQKETNPNEKEYDKGFRNEIKREWKGKRTLMDFYTSFYILTMIENTQIYINEVPKQKITQKHPLAVAIEYQNLPSVLGMLFSGKIIDFNKVIDVPFETLEESIEEIKEILSKAGSKWKNDNILTKFLYSDKKTDLDKMNMIMTICSKVFKIPLKELSILLYGIGVLGFHYNNKYKLDISEEELETTINNLVDILEQEELLTPLIGELYKLDEFLFSKAVNIIG